MTNYYSTAPKGALTSIADLLALGVGAKYYRVSRTHSGTDLSKDRYSEFTGNIGTEGGDGVLGLEYRYYWFEHKSYGFGSPYITKSSLMDAHLLPQTYNDWWMFPSYEDACAYLEVCSCCGKGNREIPVRERDYFDSYDDYDYSDRYDDYED
jgi:hypothetical protein